MTTPDPDRLYERDRDILQRIDERTLRTEAHVQELYDAVVGTLDDAGMQERQRDHERRILALEGRNAGWASRIVTLATSIATALASSWAYVTLSRGHH